MAAISVGNYTLSSTSTQPHWSTTATRAYNAREVPIYEARPNEYAAWLVEGLIKTGDDWLEITLEMSDRKEWPFLDDKTKEEGFVHTGLTLGHIQMVVYYDAAQYMTKRRIRIMPLGKDFINQQKEIDDVKNK